MKFMNSRWFDATLSFAITVALIALCVTVFFSPLAEAQAPDPFYLVNKNGGVYINHRYPFEVFTARSMNSILFASFYSKGSQTGGIAEAYAAGTAPGVTVYLGADITIGLPQTITLIAGKPLFLNLNGHKITCLNTAAVCLNFFKTDTTPRDTFEIANGIIAYAGSSPSVTGLQIGDVTMPATNVYAHGLSINGFNTAGAIGMDLIWVEDSHFDSIGFSGNTLALQLEGPTNQNQFSNVWFQQNVAALNTIDASEFTFSDCLFQSNTGQKAVTINAVTGNVVGPRIKSCHFENNGDGTASSRQISFNVAAGKQILHADLEDNIFNAGPAGSYVYEGLGAGLLYAFSFKRNQYFTASNIITGAAFTPGNATTIENDNLTNFDAGLNATNVAGCDRGGAGDVFAPFGSGRTFQIYGGWVGNFPNSLLFKDCTAGTYPLKYLQAASTWDFADRVIKTTGAVQAGTEVLSGTITSYNGVATVANGIPQLVAKYDATALAANIATTTLYTVPASGAGMYRFSCYSVVTRAATTSSSLPRCFVGWSDADTGVGGLTAFTTGAETSNLVAISTSAVLPPQQLPGGVINAQAGSVISLFTSSYASSGATSMQYAVHIKLEYLGN